jgi:hypothetical protein
MGWVLVGPANNGPKSLWREGGREVTLSPQSWKTVSLRLQGSKVPEDFHPDMGSPPAGHLERRFRMPRCREPGRRLLARPFGAKEVRPWQMVTTTSLST